MEELVEKMPFNCIITGPTNCGKTRFLIDKLRGPFRKKFEFIVMICPTFTINETYKNFAKDDKNFLVWMPDASNQDEINEALDCCKTLFSRFNILIILDDCAASQDLKKRSNKFIDLAFSGRHSKISVWVLTQQFCRGVRFFYLLNAIFEVENFNALWRRCSKMAGTSEEHGHKVLKNFQIAALLSTLGGQRIVYGIGIFKAMQRYLLK